MMPCKFLLFDRRSARRNVFDFFREGGEGIGENLTLIRWAKALQWCCGYRGGQTFTFVTATRRKCSEIGYALHRNPVLKPKKCYRGKEGVPLYACLDEMFLAASSCEPMM